MKRKWKIILGAAFGIMAIVMVIFQNTKPLETNLLTVPKEDIAKIFREEGIVKAERENHVYSLYGGKIATISVREGDKVKEGDSLVEFDNQEILYQIQSLQGQIRSIEAQKALQELTVDIETMKLLYEAGALSKKEYEDAKHTLNSDYYPALISVVRAQISQLNYQLSLRNSISPVNGTVANLTIKEGMVIPPGSPLMTIFSGDAYVIESYVLTQDASRVKPGMSVDLIQNNKGGDIFFSGTVDIIAPSAVEKISTLGLVEQRLKVTIIPQMVLDLDLKPGYSVNVDFTIDRQADQLIVPKTVLFPYNDGDALWLVKDGKAVIQPVKKGFENDRDVAITEGLVEGDLVILNHKVTGLKEGKRIKV